MTEHGNTIYPWDDWSDGKWREKVQGTDFSGETEGFRKQVIRAALKRGLRANTRVIGGVVVRFRMVKAEKKQEEKKKVKQ